jgi:Ca2+-transporting ATPase
MSALVGGTDSSVFTVVQLLWINLIMDTFAALALSTDFPTDDLFSRKPEPRTASVLTTTMWKMIMGQSIYQLAVIFTLHYAGGRLFGYRGDNEEKHLQTMVFNIYVLMQFFNQFKFVSHLFTYPGHSNKNPVHDGPTTSSTCSKGS